MSREMYRNYILVKCVLLSSHLLSLSSQAFLNEKSMIPQNLLNDFSLCHFFSDFGSLKIGNSTNKTFSDENFIASCLIFLHKC